MSDHGVLVKNDAKDQDVLIQKPVASAMRLRIDRYIDDETFCRNWITGEYEYV